MIEHSFEEPNLHELLAGLSDSEIEALVESLPPVLALVLAEELGAMADSQNMPETPIEQAAPVGLEFRSRPHLEYLSEVLGEAVRDVENGKSRKIIIEMPPRTGKTTLGTLLTPAWALARNSDWPLALTSHDGGLATSWGRQIRRWAEGGALGEHVKVAKDAGAASAWETTDGGKLLSISIRESFTGRGAKVLVIDDPHKDFVEAHSATLRKNVWEWWLSVAQTRLEPPSLVIVTLTRWHEDDFVGRLLSKDYPGNPDDWEVIRLPALAEEGDVLGRAEGEPLYSPLINETEEEAVQRWKEVRESVGEYVWSAMYQQRPAPSEGAIFMLDKLRYWTTDPARVTPDGSAVLLDPDALAHGKWLDSWDCTFKGGDNSDYVVGQRWVRVGADRYLIDQRRGRWTFTQTLDQMKAWGNGGGPHGAHVHQRLIEDTANGTAALDVLRKKIAGLKPITPRGSKEVRARAVTPEIESGNVLLPHPSEHAWVKDLISELRNFPHDKHDDQVDALTQALKELRDESVGGVTVPKSSTSGVRGTRARNATGESRLRAARSTGRRV